MCGVNVFVSARYTNVVSALGGDASWFVANAALFLCCLYSRNVVGVEYIEYALCLCNVILYVEFACVLVVS